jgi:hypothetical protein
VLPSTIAYALLAPNHRCLLLLLLLLPLQVKALTGSLLLTGLAAAGGFYALQSFGFVNSEAPTSMSAFGRAWEMVGRPLPPQQQQQQQQQQGWNP